MKDLCNDMNLYIKLLDTKDERVHEQFFMLITAITTHNIIAGLSNDLLDKKEIKNFIKSSMKKQMKIMGYHKGLFRFIKTSLYLYVFQLYEEFYQDYIVKFNVDENADFIDVQDTILQLAAYYLNEQFKIHKMADICSFLKVEDMDIFKRAIQSILK
jgi:hypothetical protein